jgi:putative transposase
MSARIRHGDGVDWGVHVRGMRYAQGGGLTVRARSRREALRFEAADMPAAGMATDRVAALLRVSARSVRRWRAAMSPPWSHGGGARCRLTGGASGLRTA